MAEKIVESAVGDLVMAVLRDHPAFSANPLGDWSELVGEQVARRTQPRSLKNKVLTILAYDPIWKHHLDLNKEFLKEKINRDRPELLVEKIVVRVGEIPESPPDLNPNHKSLEKLKSKSSRFKKKKISRRQLTEEEKALLKQIRDPELRAIGARLLSVVPLEREENEDQDDPGSSSETDSDA